MGGGGGAPPGGIPQAATPSGTFDPKGDDSPLNGAGAHEYRCLYHKDGSSRGSRSERSLWTQKFSKELLEDPTDLAISFEEPLDLKLFLEKIKIVKIKPIKLSKADSDTSHPNFVTNLGSPIDSLAGTLDSPKETKETYVRIIFAPEGKPHTSYLYQDAVIGEVSDNSENEVVFSNLNIKEKGDLSVYVSIKGKPDPFHPDGLQAFPSVEAFQAYVHSTPEWPIDYLGKFSIHEKHEE